MQPSPYTTSGSSSLFSIMFMHVDFHLGWKEPSQISISFLSGLDNKPWDVRWMFLKKGTDQLGKRRKYWFLSSLFRVFMTWSSLFLIVVWLPYLLNSWLVYEKDAFILLGHPVRRVYLKSLITSSSQWIAWRALSVDQVFLFFSV